MPRLRTFRSAYACAGFVAAVAAAGSPTASRADVVNLVANGSFEDGTYTFNGQGGQSLDVGSTVIAHWTTMNAELAPVENGNAYGLSTPYGSVFLDLTGYHDSSPYGGVQQTIATTAGASYVLSFAIGADPGDSRYTGPVGVTANVGLMSAVFTANPAGNATVWTQESLTFTAISTSTTISFVGQTAGGGQFIGLDNVSVVSATAVPEPGTLALAGLAGVAVFANRYRRRRPV